MFWRRLYRSVCRTATFADAVKTLFLIALALVTHIDKVIKTLESVRDMLPSVGVVITFILSPYFVPTIGLVALTLLIRRNWGAPNPAYIEDFIEMVEQKIRAGKAMLKRQPSVTLIEWKTWEQKTALDLAAFLDGNLVWYLGWFRRAGNLTTDEYESKDDGHKRAIKRQIRMLRELIDRADRGVLRKQAIRPQKSTS